MITRVCRHEPLTMLTADQSGFGLIELMISMVIASFLVLGLVVIAGNTQRTFTAQTDFAGLNDKERFASDLFSNAIQSAGYFTYLAPTAAQIQAGLVNNAAFMTNTFTAEGTTFAAGQYIGGTGNSSGPDTLNVRFQVQTTDPQVNSLTNCQGGNGSASTGVYESKFSIVNNNLVCDVGFNGVTPSSEVVLIEGVTNMQILYGVDATIAGSTINSGSSSEYLAANQMTTTQDWLNVRSVMVTLTFQKKSSMLTTPLPLTLIFQVMYESTYISPP